ncbi:hypothetical protein Efla_007637 [Eimeria flavescens]
MELMGRQERGEMIEKLKAELEEFKNEKGWQKLVASSRGTDQPLSARQEELRRLYQANCKLRSGERLGAKLHALNPEVEGMRDYKSKRVKLQKKEPNSSCSPSRVGCQFASLRDLFHRTTLSRLPKGTLTTG